MPQRPPLSGFLIEAAGANPDFIEVFDGLLDPAWCAAVCRRFDAAGHVEGRVGGGVFPELKKSRDLEISGRAEWNDVSGALMDAVLKALLAWLRKYPHTLLAPTAFTHTHRGNRPVGGDKYIATSWILFNRAEVIFGAP